MEERKCELNDEALKDVSGGTAGLNPGHSCEYGIAVFGRRGKDLAPEKKQGRPSK